MKKIGFILTIAFILQSCAGSGRSSETTSSDNLAEIDGAQALLSFFTLLPKDSIISTLCPIDVFFMYRGNDLSDELVLKYFLNNDRDALYTEFEAYNHDENTYTVITHKRRVTCLFAKKITDDLYLLAYWWYPKEDVLSRLVWLSLYDNKNGRFTDTRKFFAVSDFEEVLKYGIIFDNNHVLTVETLIENGKAVSYLEYFAIDKNSMTFQTLQRSRTNQPLWHETICDARRPIAIGEPFKEELRNAGFTIEFIADGRIKNGRGTPRLHRSIADKNNPQSILYAFLRFREWSGGVRAIDRMIVDSLAANGDLIIFYVTNDTNIIPHEWGLESIGERKFGNIRDFKDDYLRIWVRIFTLDTIHNSIAFQGHFAKGLEEEEDNMFFFTYRLSESFLITDIDGTYKYNPNAECPTERFTIVLSE